MFTITSDATFKAIYTTNTYTITVNVNGGSGTASSNTPTVVHGNSVIITLAPDSGYEVDSVKVGGSIVATTGLSHTISNITTDTVIEVVFRLKTYNINISLIGDYGVVNATPTTVNQNGSTIITLKPDKGYEVDTVTVDGRVVAVNSNTVTINSITSDVSVVVTFKRLTKVITWCFQKKASNGIVTTTDITSLDLMASGTVPTGLQNGCTVLAVKVDGVICSFGNFSTDYTITSENSSVAGVITLINGVLGTYSSTLMCRGKKAGRTAFVVTDKVTNAEYRLPVIVSKPSLKLVAYGVGDIASDLTRKDAIPKSSYNRNVFRTLQEVANLSMPDDKTYVSGGKTYGIIYDADVKLTVLSNNNVNVSFDKGPSTMSCETQVFSNVVGPFNAKLKIDTCGASLTADVSGTIV